MVECITTANRLVVCKNFSVEKRRKLQTQAVREKQAISYSYSSVNRAVGMCVAGSLTRTQANSAYAMNGKLDLFVIAF